jgi:hypothetical protein
MSAYRLFGADYIAAGAASPKVCTSLDSPIKMGLAELQRYTPGNVLIEAARRILEKQHEFSNQLG